MSFHLFLEFISGRFGPPYSAAGILIPFVQSPISLHHLPPPMKLFEKIMMRKKEPDKAPAPPEVPAYWIETSESVSYRCEFDPSGQLSVKILDDSRPVFLKVADSFVNKFFPSGYPYSVNEGYLRYTQFRALQHLTSAALSVLSTQSLLFAAGLRPTPAQATVVSWVLKDGMQHMGKLICSNLGARMDSEPKCWRILADVLYDFGTGLEVLSPLCPQLFLQVAGFGNFAKGMAVVAARATRLPIYSAFAKEGNLSDLFAKGEAISTVFNVIGMGAGIQLASTVCSSMQGKMVVGPLLSMVHVYCVIEEMRATPINTLNPQRTAMIVADFLKTGKVSSPADLRYREDLLFPGRLIKDAGNVRVGRSFHEVIKPSKLGELKGMFPEEKFLLSRGNKGVDMLLEQNASGEDALRGWLVAGYTADIEKSFRVPSPSALEEAYEKMNDVFGPFVLELQAKGWHTDRFLDGTGSRFAWGSNLGTDNYSKRY
ncbi:protein root UVB sensitive 2, chloroplastic-like [Malus sylvestris]|uniref:protein root UVB sensitive 2, chloroplastic-like n=1 Tax=Malus sylvestris TaxID=3752 RepID=UPI0021ACEFD2|nr:protein root UVB sensitive 2, chloroplastic-like [Malus sylvestris]